MSLLQYLDTVLFTLCTSRPEEFFKIGVLKNIITFIGKHLRRVLFCNQAATWRPTTSLNAESGRGALL